MQVNGSIPMHVARAYGLQAPSAPCTSCTSIAETKPVDPVRPAAQNDAQEPSANVQRLLAGAVPGAVDFASASTPAAPAGPYQLYSRAADKIEAAVAVRLGQSIDLKG